MMNQTRPEEMFPLAEEQMRPEDLKHAAQQLNKTNPEDPKVDHRTPEQFVAMKDQADAQLSYAAITSANTLKQQGKELHGRGLYAEAAAKYELARDCLKNVPSAAAQTLRAQCSHNLMSCYLKLGRFQDCVNEASEVIRLGWDHDSSNVAGKAYYWRGQAYRALGSLHAAMVDLCKGQEISPTDESIDDVLNVLY